jgi:voltage-gated potassium channel
VDYYEPIAKQFESDMLDLRGRLLGALSLIIAVTIVGIIGFSIIDPNAGLIRAFYMTAITLTTVGFGEEIAVDTDGARIFTAVLILFGMGATLYFVSTSTAFLLEGQLGNVFRRKKMVRDLAALEGHMIVCGSGSTALYAATELSAVERPVVLVVPVASEANEGHLKLSSVPIVVGDPTDDETLEAAGVTRAHGLIACAHSDNENVVITLTARQLNPKIRIVARLQDVSHEAKVRKVGANAVVSPQHIGGLRLASELIRPTVVTFLDRMLRDRDKNLRIEEVIVSEGAPAAGKAINALGLEDLPGILLLAVRADDGAWQYNPQRTQVVQPGEVLIFLGSPEDSKALRDRLGGQLLAESSKAV